MLEEMDRTVRWYSFAGLLCVAMGLFMIGAPGAYEVPLSDCWSSCSTCQSRCQDDSCEEMCENINQVCCSAQGKRPFLSCCGCH